MINRYWMRSVANSVVLLFRWIKMKFGEEIVVAQFVNTGAHRFTPQRIVRNNQCPKVRPNQFTRVIYSYLMCINLMCAPFFVRWTPSTPPNMFTDFHDAHSVCQNSIRIILYFGFQFDCLENGCIVWRLLTATRFVIGLQANCVGHTSPFINF